MPQMHPATVAAHVAMFDQLCRGRFIFGIGPGGLVSDFELFNVGDAPLRVVCACAPPYSDEDTCLTE